MPKITFKVVSFCLYRIKRCIGKVKITQQEIKFRVCFQVGGYGGPNNLEIYQHLDEYADVCIFILISNSCVQCDQKKSPNVYKSCPKMISLEK